MTIAGALTTLAIIAIFGFVAWSVSAGDNDDDNDEWHNHIQ